MNIKTLTRGRPLAALLVLSLAVYALGMTILPILFWPGLILFSLWSAIIWYSVIRSIARRHRS
ncbi:hypothetical protein [Phenylobacterium sp.]|uniref:hypothetical protein n=1 Tax=Phenylobacterium sp. TaxID=1871053 RepID=UPI002FE07739